MDWNTVDALGSFLSGIASLLSLAGIIFAVFEIRRARHVVDRETDYRIYEMMLDVDRFFFDNPDMRPYIYEGQEPPEGFEDTPDYQRLLSAVEYLLDFFECAYTQFDLMPVYQRIGWIQYMAWIGQNSPFIKRFIDEEQEWYMPSFVHLILTGEYDPRLDKADYKGMWQKINKAHWRNRLPRRSPHISPPTKT